MKNLVLRENQPLTPAQLDIFLHQQRFPKSPFYVIGGYYHLKGALDYPLLKRIILDIINTESAFRIRLAMDSDIPSQYFTGEVRERIPFADFSKEQNAMEKAVAWLKEDFGTAFSLDGMLYQIVLVKLSAQECLVYIKVHHLIMDGWGFSIFIQRLASAYEQKGAGITSETTAFDFKDAILEIHRQSSDPGAYEAHKEYWKHKFSVLPAPLLSPYKDGDEVKSKRFLLEIPYERYQLLEQLATENKVSIFHVLLGLFYVYFTRAYQTDELVIGLPVHNRTNARFKKVMGMFVSTSPARFSFGTDLNFRQLLSEIRQSQKQDYRYQSYPLGQIHRDLQLHTKGRDQLFDVSFSYEKFDYNIKAEGLDEILPVTFTHEHDPQPFNIFVREYQEGQPVLFDIQLSENYFREGEGELICNRLKHLIHSIPSHADTPISQLDWLPEEEKLQLFAFNDTREGHSFGFPTFIEAFRFMADQYPDKTALIAGGQRLTYRELNEQSDLVASWLRHQGAGKDVPVAVCMQREASMLVTLLGIWKAGSAYVPVDPEYPEERIALIIENAGCALAITQPAYYSKFSRSSLKAVSYSDMWEAASSLNRSDTRGIPAPDDLAYIIYTSGSTGIPKGVAIEHGSVINFLEAMAFRPGFESKDCLLAVTTISFDIHVLELYLPLMMGGTIVLATASDARDAFELQSLIDKYRVTVMQATPATWKMMFLAEWRPDRPFKALCGGEALPLSLLQSFRPYTQVALWNMYGPTEATVWASVQQVDLQQKEVSIGHPIQHTSYYILDRFLYPSGFELSGELYIGGVCLARGYHRLPEKTEESFRMVPVSSSVPERIYKTGDRVALGRGQQLRFQSRADDQVKVRGFRIEQGEIEAALVSHPAIKDGTVRVWKDQKQDNYLAAYCVKRTGQETDEETLISYLSEKLPRYMIPSVFCWLENLPLTPNGKVDKKALPEPHHSIGEAVFIAPGNELERKLAEIWSSLFGMEKLSIRDDYFALGGDSITNISMVNKARAMGLPVEPADIFAHSTIEALASLVAARTGEVSFSIPVAPAAEFYPTTAAQKRLYILNQLEGTAIAYNMAGALQLEGAIDMERLEMAFRQLIQRHEVFRTSFRMMDQEVFQQVEEQVDFQVEVMELKESESIEEKIRSFIRPFDLQKAPLLRSGFIRQSEKSGMLLVDMHHIISDGLSVTLFLEDFIRLYRQEQPEPLKIQYKDYACWEQDMSGKNAAGSKEAYWLSQFRGTIPVLDLPADHTRPAVQSYEGRRIRFVIDPATTAQIRTLARDHKTTLYTVLLTAYNVLLSKYTGQEDIVVGTPVAMRPHEDLQRIVGMFVNTLALRNFPSPHKTFTGFLREVKENTQKAFEHQDYPLEQLLEKLQIPRDISRNPLFDTMLVLQHQEIKSFESTEIRFSPLEIEHGISKFDLTIDAVEREEEIALSFEYSTRLFRQETIQRMAGHLIQLLAAASRHPQQPISEMDIVTAAEKEQILLEFNNTSRAFPDQETLTSIFETQVAKTPDAVAVMYGGSSLTYKTLNEKSNQLARKLKAGGVKAGSIVGMLTDRSLEMPVGILAILKAGGAYLPIGTDYPADRIEYMLQDSGAGVLLTQQAHVRKAAFQGEIIDLTDPGLYEGETSNPEAASGPTDLAYVIYTSGSTGRPKGAMIEHRSAVNRIQWMQNEYPIGERDVILQKTPYTFDVSVWELFWWAFTGSSVYFLEPGGEKDPGLIMDTIEKQKITTMHFVPSMLNASLEYLEAQGGRRDLSSLRQVFASGEALNVSQAEKFNRLLYDRFGTKLHNLYGPTEAAVDVSYFDCSTGRQMEIIPIGKPIDNIRLYVLDAAWHLQPIGVPGELYISGVGVGRGYLNRPDLTAEKFLSDPFFAGERMYRTGDLARWLPDGNIEYLGRMDHQVKIRGFRIELGEIENQLLKHEALREAVVTARDNAQGVKHLCAYFVAERQVEAEELRVHIQHDLPEYMVPSYFIQLDKMPLSANGKADRKALPEPSFQAVSSDHMEAPQTAVEATLAEIWKGVLGISAVGINQNFFHLGGDSIKAIQVSARAGNAGLKVEVKDVFRYPEIRNLAQHTTRADRMIPQGMVTGEAVLTPIQQRYFHLGLENIHYYNQSVLLQRAQWDEDLVRMVFHGLAAHHDALRMSFKIENDRVLPYVRGTDQELFTLRVIDLSAMEVYKEAMQSAMTGIHEGIHIEGPLAGLGLFRTKGGDFLFIAIHHLVVDGISWRILLEDLGNGYKKVLNGEKISFPQKTDSYLYWSQKVSDYGRSNRIRKELSYWTQTVKDAAQYRLPASAQEACRIKDSGLTEVVLGREETEALLKQVHKAYLTEANDILLTALGLAVHAWTGREKVAIALEGHGREQIASDLHVSRTVGWFTSLFPVVLDLSAHNDLSKTIRVTKEQLRRVPLKGIGYGILRYLTEEGFRIESDPQISFNYLGQLNDHYEAFTVAATDLATSGENKLIYPIDINGAVKDGHLHFSIRYDRHQFEPQLMENLATHFMKHLQTVISHCTQMEEEVLTPSDLGDSSLSLNDLDHIMHSAGSQAEISKIYALSPTQSGMLFHVMQDKKSAVYFEQLALDLNNLIDPLLLEKSLNQLILKHDILRTAFVYQGISEPRQVVLRERKQQVKYHDLSSAGTAEKEERLKSIREEDIRRGFDLSEDVLLRLSLIRTGASSCQLLFSFHHIILDGWSCALLLESLFKTYAALKHGKTIDAKPETQFEDYINWLRDQDADTAAAYWKEYLQGFDSKTGFIHQAKRAPENDYSLQELSVDVEDEVVLALKDTARAQSVTFNTMLQAVWGVVLQRYNNTEDAVFGAVLSGRPSEIKDIESMLGLFINTIPVRVRGKGTMPFRDLLKEMQAKAPVSENHSYIPLAEIQQQSQLRNELMDHILVFENYPVDQAMLQGLSETYGETLSITNIALYEQTHYDLNVLIVPGGRMKIRFNYNSAVYSTTHVKRIAGHFLEAMKSVAKDQNIALQDISILTENDLHQIHAFNAGQSDLSGSKTIHQLFEAQARKTPDAVAVMHEGAGVSYRELNDHAEKIASCLISQGIGREDAVAIIAERSPMMIAAVLGALKAGAVFVPVDPQYPEDRIAYILNDSNTVIVLTDKLRTSVGPDFYGRQILFKEAVDRDGEMLHASADATGDQLLYIIYTSGTTGKPKGVMLEHSNMVNLIRYQQEEGIADFTGKVLQFTTLSFDVCYQEIFSTLLGGGCLYIIDEEKKRDVPFLLGFIRENEIPTIFLPTAYLKFLFGYEEYVRQVPACIRHIITAGEQLTVSDLLRKYLKGTGAALHNHYGPSETHVVTTYILDGQQELADVPPIGKPVTNNRIYIFDQYRNLQPAGALGEIYIAGMNVGRGYIGNELLTYSRFEEDPYVKGARMYRTGDLGRWLESGDVEYAGRTDHQVKIRGYRIEPGEIESRLLSHPEISQAAVIDRSSDKGEKYLIGYIATATALTSQEVKEYLMKELPEYMVPAYIVSVPAIPLTLNGKVDRRALPEPEMLHQDNSYIAPATATETKLARIWTEILKAERISLHDDFFELGGHSLKASLLVAYVQKSLEVHMPLKEVFVLRTLQQMAAFIDRATAEVYIPIPAAAEAPSYPLSSAQKRLYILDQFADGGTAYNMPFAARIEGKADTAKLEHALTALIRRHEAFRTSFKLEGGEPVQIIHPEVHFHLETEEAAEADIAQVMQSFVRPFELSKAPLIHARLLKIKGGSEHLLLLDMHHIVSDLVTLEVFVEEFVKIYHGETLSPPVIHYKDYAVWQDSMKESERMQQQKAYWKSVYSAAKGEIPVLSLPLDHTRPSVQSFEGRELYFNMEPSLLEGLRKTARETGSTAFMITFAAYNILLSKYSGQEDIIVGTPVAGRTHPDLKNMAGLFVNTLAFRSQPKAELTFLEFLMQVREHLLQGYQHQDYPFEELLEDLNLKRDLSRNPLFDVFFSYQNDDGLVLKTNDFLLIPLDPETDRSKLDLTFSMYESADGGRFSVNYSTKLFRESTIRRMAGHYVNVLRTILENPEIMLKEISMISEAEKMKITDHFNDTFMEYRKDITIHRAFEEAVMKNPDALALSYREESLTYRELNRRANQVARLLQSKGAGPDKIVGIMMERSARLVVCLLGILKSGAAYVPLVPELPDDRILSMINDADVGLVLTDKNGISDHSPVYLQDNRHREFLYMDELEPVLAHECGDDAASAFSSEKNLAYVIYTSGSTGIPKGVMIEHQGVINLATWFHKKHDLHTNRNMLQMTSIGFDVSVEEIIVPLLNGASVFIMENEEKMDKGKFTAFIKKHQIHIAEIVPTLLNDYIIENERLESLRVIVTGAEKLDEAIKDSVLDKGYKLYNIYGPTETTVNASSKKCEKGSDTIGVPMANTSIFILDKWNKLMPVGVPGELCVTGDSLARGYLNSPELNREKFAIHPFREDARMYRTGDLVCWTEEGEIRFLGRIDHQVKIRGYRIELGEIEAQLGKLEEIRRVIVLVKEDKGGKYLCAYYTAHSDLPVAEIRRHLAKELPDYMIPSYFVRLDKMPLTANGKVDRKALPEPDKNLHSSIQYVAPSGGMEEAIAAVWAEVAGTDRVGMLDNFFEIGGHSLKAVAVIARVNKLFAIDLSLMDLFKAQHLKAFADTVQQAVSGEHQAPDKHVALLNGKRDRHVFLFPPALGQGLAYKGLTPYIDTHSLYSFNYINDPRRLEIYCELIRGIQQEGPYLLMGYSAGGNLAFEVARELIRQGYEVSDIVMIDAVRRTEQFPAGGISRESLRRDIEAALKQNGITEVGEAFLEKSVNDSYAYSEYMDGLVNEGVIHSNIHLIIAEERSDPEEKYHWSGSTTGDVLLYQGRGKHIEMLGQSLHMSFNAALIGSLLASRERTGKEERSEFTGSTL